MPKDKKSLSKCDYILLIITLNYIINQRKNNDNNPQQYEQTFNSFFNIHFINI